MSATASQNRATNQRGEDTRRGALPSMAVAWAVGASESAIASRKLRSAGSRGPIRQPSYPSASTVGTSRPREMAVSAPRAAADHPWTERPADDPAGSETSSSNTAASGTTVTGTVRWRTLFPAGRTNSTVRLNDAGVRVGCHRASSPARAGVPGRNTASIPGPDRSASGAAIGSRIGTLVDWRIARLGPVVAVRYGPEVLRAGNGGEVAG